MDESSVKVRKKSKTGPLKSTPGFLKCMRSVYLYFKEEKEKGALNIPINSFIERTAVTCGVGRKTLYNYAKKGLFDEHSSLLVPKQKKRKGKKKLKLNGTEDPSINKRGRKKLLPTPNATINNNAGPSGINKKKPVMAKNAMIQTDPKQDQVNNINMQTNPNESDNNGFSHFMITREQKPAQIQLVQQNKVREVQHVISGPWATAPPIKRDVDYFAKNNIWQTVYSVHTSESQTCSADITTARMTSCQLQQPTQHTQDHLTDL